MTKVLVLDNYDSFTYNLVHQVKAVFNGMVRVCKNDEIDIEEVEAFDQILLSPGPGLPAEAGIMPQLISRYAASKSILGICLGHQAIAEAFGASLLNTEVYHGVSKPVHYEESEQLFLGMPNPFQAGRYHSWMVNRESFPDSLRASAWDEKGNIMALSHRTFTLWGVQFHPESIMTVEGNKIIANWLNHLPA